jgi:hypothetical protein
LTRGHGETTTASASSRRTGRKRGNGEDNIRQRPDGLWEARLTLPDGTSKSLHGKTPKEVAEKLGAALTSMRQGLPLPSGRVTLGRFAGRWLAEAVKPSKRATMYRVYEQMTATTSCRRSARWHCPK